MNFKNLQDDLQEMTQDDSTAWASWGTSNKKCLNIGYERVFDLIKNSSVMKNYYRNEKVKVTITNKVWTLPVDFDTEIVVSWFDFDTNSDIELTQDRIFTYSIYGEDGSKKIVLEEDTEYIYISYVKLRTDMSLDADVPKFPKEIHRCIVDFALVEYFRRQRDLAEADASLKIATVNLQNILATIW